ncbi:MAG: hypothetical protein WA966_03270 [Ornithinimicrobium sp.]
MSQDAAVGLGLIVIFVALTLLLFTIIVVGLVRVVRRAAHERRRSSQTGSTAGSDVSRDGS